MNLGLLTLLIGLAILSNYNIYLRGYWTTKIIIWIFIFTAIILFAFGHKQTQNKLERIYYGLFFYFPLACIPLCFIPFLGWGIVLGVYGKTIGEQNDIKYSDNKYRLQHTYKGFIAPAAPPDLYVKHGLFEYKEKPLEVEYLGDCDSIRINEITDREIKITFYHGEHFTDEKNPIELYIILEK